MPITKDENATFSGTLYINERDVDVLFTSESRDLVEWKLRLEFADRLEKAARDMKMLEVLLADVDWHNALGEDASGVVETQIAKYIRDLSQNLEDLRDNEPALMLCADHTGDREVTLEHGEPINMDYGDWSESRQALVDRVERARVDASTGGVVTRALDALAAAGHRGPETAREVLHLTRFLGYTHVREQLGCDDMERLVAAHLSVVMKLAPYENPKERNRNGEWTSAMRQELMSPKERETNARKARVIARFLHSFDKVAKRAPKRTIAAKRVRRAKSRRAS